VRRLGAGDILAILFVVAGALPIVWWLGSWLYHSMTPSHVVPVVLVVGALYVTWWVRKRLEKRRR